MENTITKDTSNKIRIIQVVFTVMVVYIHAYNLDVYGVTRIGGIDSLCYYLERILYYITAVAVPGFFFLSGYLFYVNLGRCNIKAKYIKRFYSLVIPYFIWNTIAYVFWIVLENIPAIAQRLSMTHGWELTPASFVYALMAPVNSPLWYMRNLFAVLLIAVPLWYCIKQKWGYIPLVGLLIISVLVKADKYNLIYDIFMFSFGGYVAIHLNKLFQSKNKHIQRVSIAVLSVYVIISVLLPEIDYKKYGIQLLVDIVIFLGFWFCFNVNTLGGNKLIAKISGTRTFIYFSHSILLESMEKLFFIALGKSVVTALVDYIIMPVMVVCVLVVIGGFIQKHAVQIWKVLNGYR